MTELRSGGHLLDVTKVLVGTLPSVYSLVAPLISARILLDSTRTSILSSVLKVVEGFKKTLGTSLLPRWSCRSTQPTRSTGAAPGVLVVVA